MIMSHSAEEIAKAKAKISKLLNMTVENGCSEDEQETAMAMAAGIATRLGIDLEAQRQKEPTAAQRKAIRKSFMQEWKIHQAMAFEAAGRLYGCDVYTYSSGKGGLFFVGRDENVELAEQTAFWLMRQVELLYKEHLPRGLSQSVRAQYRKTFKAACAYRVRERAYELMRQMKTQDQAAQAATGQNALVVQGYFEQLKRENDAFWELTPEQKALADQRRLEREQAELARRNAMTQLERDAEDRELERQRKKEERAAARRKGPRIRRLPTGIGTNAGLAAGDRVQLRKEVR
jgi:hypothetical protein